MNGAVSVFVILASACTVLTGLVLLTRAIFRIAIDLRDNKNATVANTAALKDFAGSVNPRMTAIEQWIRDHDRNGGNNAI